MNGISRTITGLVIGCIGAAWLLAAYKHGQADGVVAVIMGVSCIGVGTYIFFNTKEDNIDELDNK